MRVFSAAAPALFPNIPTPADLLSRNTPVSSPNIGEEQV
jgi:hypothetical protein